jgi:surface protein
MFSGCTKIEFLDLSTFNTKNVKNMSGMFGEFNVAFFAEDKFNNLDLNNMPKTFEHIFHGCIRLINVNINSFDMSNVIKMIFMFGNCRNLTNLDLSNFNTKNVTNMMGMFNNC